MLMAYIQANVANGCIERSSAPAAGPIIFAKEKDGRLRLFVDYCALNKVTVKNQYPLALTSAMLDRVREATLFIMLDIRRAQRFIRI
jgi:hypothetical protein